MISLPITLTFLAHCYDTYWSFCIVSDKNNIIFQRETHPYLKDAISAILSLVSLSLVAYCKMDLSFSQLYHIGKCWVEGAALYLSTCLFRHSSQVSCYISIPVSLPPSCPGPVAPLSSFPGSPYCLPVLLCYQRQRQRLRWEPEAGRGLTLLWNDVGRNGDGRIRASSCFCCHLGEGWGLLVLTGVSS